MFENTVSSFSLIFYFCLVFLDICLVFLNICLCLIGIWYSILISTLCMDFFKDCFEDGVYINFYPGFIFMGIFDC